jgi:O-antigen ligase
MIHNSLFNKLHRYLFFLLLLLLPTQLGYHWWPGWALVLGRRIDYLSPTLYATDILIFFVILFWIIESFSKNLNHESGIMNHGKNKFPISSIIHNSLFIIPLCFFIGGNIYFAANRMVAIFAWIKILELAALGVYIVKTKPKFSSIVLPLSVGVFYSSVIAIIQFLLQHSVGGPLWFLGERTFTASTPGIARFAYQSFYKLRAYATFPHPNVLGGYLAILLPGIIQYANNPIIKLSNAKKLFYITTIVLGFTALLLTFSRSAWVVCGIAIAFAIARILNTEWRMVNKKIKMFFVFIIILYSLFMIQVFLNVGFQDESFVVREQLNTAAISMFASSPVIGNGLGNFLVQLPDYLVSRTIYFLQPVHNIYLLALAETGIIGFAIFLWVLWKAVANNKIIIPILLLGFIDHYFLTLQQGQLLFTIFLSLSLSSFPFSDTVIL